MNMIDPPFEIVLCLANLLAHSWLLPMIDPPFIRDVHATTGSLKSRIWKEAGTSKSDSFKEYNFNLKGKGVSPKSSISSANFTFFSKISSDSNKDHANLFKFPTYPFLSSHTNPEIYLPPPKESSMNPSYAAQISRQRPSYIPDNFSSLDQVVAALREAGLESSNLILGIDFTKSNEWTGKYSFNRKSLHAIGSISNPYEQAISIIGRTLSPFDDDNLIPCFGFGDATTHDQSVFSFYPDHRPCSGFEEALSRYREILPYLHLSGPTSFAPVINAAIDIVEQSNGQYHVLVIIADGQVTRSSDIRPGRFSPQEQATIDSLVAASRYPLSIVLVGVGDGPWDAMKQFDDNIPQREFDNFQFVNFTEIMANNKDISKKEAAFALAALMEIPIQYRATQSMQLTGKKSSGPRVKLLPPPRGVIDHDNAVRSASRAASFEPVAEPAASSELVCPICLTNPRNMAFQCGHMTCKECGPTLATCPLCREPIKTRIRLYT